MMLSSALIFTVVGTGEASYTGDGGVARGAGLNQPFDMALDKRGNLYFSEADNHCVRRVERHSGIITTVAGTGQAGYTGDHGPALQATFNGPKEIAVDHQNNIMLVDTENHCIRRIEAASRLVTTVAGTGQAGGSGDGGPATAATLKRPHGACLDELGNIYIGDSENHRVRFVSTLGEDGLPW